MARIEGTGIKDPSKQAEKRYAAVYKPTKKDPFDAINTFLDIKTREAGTGGYAPGRDPDDPYKFNRGAFFSPDGGAYRDVQVASADLGSLNVGDSFTGQADKNIASADTGTDEGFNKFVQKDFGVGTESSTYQSFPNYIKKDLKDQYRDSLNFKEGTQINQAPVKKPSLIERTANLAGSIFNAATGTQPAAASQVPGGVTNQTQFTSSNLDASKASTGDTSFASYRMAGQTPTTTTPQTLASKQESKTYEQNRLKTGEKFADRGQREAVNASGPQQANVRGVKSERPKTVTVDGQTVAARQTVASLPSNYKQTEAAAFKKAESFQKAKRVADRNPNVSINREGRAEATNNTGVARAQAAAVNRTIDQKSISQVKAENKKAMQDRARKRNEAFKKSRSQKKKSGGGFGKSTSTTKKSASKKSAPKKKSAPSTNKRAQAAAKRRASQAKARARKAKSKSSKSKSSKSKSSKSKSSKSSPGSARGRAAARGRTRRRGRRGRGRRCDIFLKYNISPLMNMNLIRDDLAEVAYFVKEIQE